jgi:mannitol/fructose-specific phosphotransferase system IIA component (Ntr-type)
MVLANVITDGTVKLDVSDVDKWTLIEDLVDLIVKSGRAADREAILTAVVEREQQGSTGLGHGIAIPHARADGVDGVVGALAISSGGIDFDSADDKPVHLVFLIVAPPNESTRYLKTLSAITFIGKSESRTARLLSASSPGEVVSILEENGEPAL